MLTTHVGSLPRPRSLERLLIQRERGIEIDRQIFEKEVAEGIDRV